MAEVENKNTENKNNKGTNSALPVSIDKEETRYKILSELIKAEDYYVRKIHSSRHSIAHEILSDSSAIVGALTTFQLGYIKSLIAVSPIVGMLLWEGAQAKKDLKRLHRVAELYRKTRDARYFHVLGLELEGIPRTEDLSWEQKKKVEKDINDILRKPVSFGSTLKNLREDNPEENVERAGNNLRRTRAGQALEIGKQLIKAGKATPHFLWDTIVDLKNLKTLPVNYVVASATLAKQAGEVVYRPLATQFAKAAKPVRDRIASFRRSAANEENIVTVARVVRSKTAAFDADPVALTREIKRVKDSLRRASIESTVNGVAFLCQTAFVVNQAMLTHSHMLQDEWSMAAGIAIPSLLALSPLNYFAKNQIDKNRQMNSSRADVAKRLEQHAQTLKAVKMVKGLIKEIQQEEDEDKHLKMAQQLVDMFGDDFKFDWFENEQRQKLKTLFDFVASHNAEQEAAETAEDSAETGTPETTEHPSASAASGPSGQPEQSL